MHKSSPRALVDLFQRWFLAPIGVRGRRLVTSCGGTAAVEFALVLPLFLAFVFGITTFGSAFFVQSAMENAAREGARRIAVAEATFSGTDVACSAAAAGSAEQYACSYLPNWAATFTVNATEVCPARNVVVRVSADGSKAALGDIYGYFTGQLLGAVVIMRKEAECP